MKFRWLAANIRTFLLAFTLAVTVWVIAVTASNPDETQVYPNPIPIQFLGQDPGLILIGTSAAQQVELTLRAPHSTWETLLSGDADIQAIVDLTGLGAGTHVVNIQVQVNASPIRIISASPKALEITLEPQATETFTVDLQLTGSPAIGYEVGNPLVDPRQVIASGAESLVAQVEDIRAVLDLTNARQKITTTLILQALDKNGQVVKGVSIIPSNVQVNLSIVQQGGYRDLAVKVLTVGTPASGYSLTSVSALPPIVTIYSANSDLITSMPGYVETAYLDLNGAKSDIEKQLEITLPPGVTLIGDQSVTVIVGISPIEGSRTISYRPVEWIGLAKGYSVEISPQTVDIILSGPIPLLDALNFSDVKVQVDLTGLAPGTHRLTPQVFFGEQKLKLESILPGTVEVVITAPSPITPTP